MTESQPPRRRSKADLLVESAVIVLSILFAFWVDASWDIFTARGRTQEHLEAIRLELEDNLRLIDRGEAVCERVLESTNQLITLMGPNPPSIPPDSLSRLFLGTFTSTPQLFRTAALETMISAGAFAEIESVELQRGLNAWLAGSVIDRERIGARHKRAEESAMDYLIEVMPWHHVTGQWLTLGRWSEGPTSEFPVDVRAILSAPRIESLIGQVRAMKGFLCGREVNDRKTVTELLDLLAVEREGGSR